MLQDPIQRMALEIFEALKEEYIAASDSEDLRQMLIQIKTFILFREDFLSVLNNLKVGLVKQVFEEEENGEDKN